MLPLDKVFSFTIRKAQLAHHYRFTAIMICSIHDTLSLERIRRITGYLTGTIDRWNNAKRAELHDRVKHDKV